MRLLKRLPRLLCALASVAAALTADPAAAAAPATPASGTPATIHWQTHWSEALFAQAAREHRFVLLDLHAVWCHWCHVMDDETYSDRSVIALIGARYLAVSIDADSDPALASRYGDWGWPATIVLAPDGTEIVKRRGFIPPAQMAALLKAIIDDPTPGPSVFSGAALSARGSGVVTAAQRAAFARTYEEAYDDKYGGWGSGQKFLDAPTLEYTLMLVIENRDATAERRARQTLDANLKLIDPVWGGVSQYSETIDWNSPHYEKLLAFQADDMRLYAEAYARWHEPRYLEAAQALDRYLTGFLRSTRGTFYVSQDADLSATITGHDYYALGDAERRKLGIPRIDMHEYSRESGWAIRGLCRLHDVTGDPAPLAQARTAAQWMLMHRALPDGGFRHDDIDQGGPYLGDTLAMAQGFVALYRSTGERTWLESARAALGYIERHFRDARGGYFTAPAPASAVGVFRNPARTVEENAALARLANMLNRYTADAQYREAGLHALKFLAAAAAPDELRTDVLLADHELATAPVHITVVGGKHDPAAQALHAAALQFPADYLQVDWWDRDEGPLPNPEIQYPVLKSAAAFACTQNSCSTPVYEPASINPTVAAALYSD
ncbi:MAG: DUF255 domain-containing protein [Steroidobacteraceae bacterium]|jgi:uncharacterized protein